MFFDYDNDYDNDFFPSFFVFRLSSPRSLQAPLLLKEGEGWLSSSIEDMGWLITRGEFILVASLEIILKIIFKIIID